MGNKLQQELYNCIEEQRVYQVERIIKEHNQLVNQQLLSSVTPLYKAVLKNNIHIIRLLIHHQACLDTKVKGFTPLHCASIRGYVPIIKQLHSNKADISILSDEGLNCLDYAVLYGQYSAALYLVEHIKVKQLKFYQDYKKQQSLPSVHYQLMLQCLQGRMGQQLVPQLRGKKANKIDLIWRKAKAMSYCL